MIKNSKERW